MALNKRSLKKKILEELEMLPVVLSICTKHGISRQTYYRWRNEDPEFRKKVEDVLELGRESINELAESKVIQKINDGERWATEYWLTHNNPRYMKRDNPLKTVVLGEEPPIALVQFMKPIGKSKASNKEDQDGRND